MKGSFMHTRNAVALLKFAERKFKETKKFTIVLRYAGRELFVDMGSVAGFDGEHIYLNSPVGLTGVGRKVFPISCVSRLEFC